MAVSWNQVNIATSFAAVLPRHARPATDRKVKETGHVQITPPAGTVQDQSNRKVRKLHLATTKKPGYLIRAFLFVLRLSRLLAWFVGLFSRKHSLQNIIFFDVVMIHRSPDMGG